MDSRTGRSTPETPAHGEPPLVRIIGGAGSGVFGPSAAPRPEPNSKCSMLKPMYTARRRPSGQLKSGRRVIAE